MDGAGSGEWRRARGDGVAGTPDGRCVTGGDDLTSSGSERQRPERAKGRQAGEPAQSGVLHAPGNDRRGGSSPQQHDSRPSLGSAVPADEFLSDRCQAADGGHNQSDGQVNRSAQHLAQYMWAPSDEAVWGRAVFATRS